LSLRLPASVQSAAAYAPTQAIFAYFLHLPDALAATAHFRPEALRKIRQTRDEQAARLQRAARDEVAEARAQKRDREKKERRDALLKSLSAEEQRKRLEREREKGARKDMRQKRQAIFG
jgi:Skp family chaperone for outer membrane proteins